MGKQASKSVWSPTAPADPPEELMPLADAIFDQVIQSRKITNGLTTEVLDSDAKACRWLVSALYEAAVTFPPAGAVLPLSKNRFVADHAMGTNLPPYKSTRRAIEAAETLGYVEVLKNSYVPGVPGLASRMYAAGLALEKFKELGPVWKVVSPISRTGQIMIGSRRKGTRRRLNEAELLSPHVQHCYEQMGIINDLLAETCVCLDVSDGMLEQIVKEMIDKSDDESDADAEFKRTEVGINFSERQLIRIFGDEHMNTGGRFYGGWWQGIPDHYRRNIIINDSPTIEIDFSGMAIRCLYAWLGLNLPDDPYDIGLNYKGSQDEKRKLVKKYLTARLNDQDKRYWLSKEEQDVLGLSQKELDRRINQKHPSIAHHFGSRVGMKLQFLDSEIAIGVMLALAQDGIPCLPIHDSFIVPALQEFRLLNLMQAEFNRVVGTYCPVSVDRTPNLPTQWSHVWRRPPGQNVVSHVKNLNDILNTYFIRQTLVGSWYEWRHLNGASGHLIDIGFEEMEEAATLLNEKIRLPSDQLQAELRMSP